MNPVDKLFEQSEKSMLKSGHRTRVTVISGASKGRIFYCRMDLEPVIDPNMPLGGDPRMQTVMRVLRISTPALASQDMLLDENGVSWKVLRMENNAASVTNDFWLEQQI